MMRAWLKRHMAGPDVPLTLALGGAGGLVAALLGFPAAFLTGSALAVTAGSLAGLQLRIPPAFRNLCFIAIGLSMGAGVSPDVLETMATWPAAFLMLTGNLLLIFMGCYWLLRQVWRFNRETSVLASSPGHLSYILGLSSQTGADIPSISIIQSIRVLALTVLVPFSVSFMVLGRPAAGPLPAALPPSSLAASFVMAFLLGWCLQRVKVPAAFLLGGMLVSTGTHITGVMTGQIPQWLTIAAFTIMGSLIGTRFVNVGLAALKRAAFAGLATTFFAAICSIAIGALAASWLDLPLAQLLIAFAPGGVEAMAAMAVIMDVDTTFVAAQHVFRLFFLTFLAPALLLWQRGRTADRD